MKISVVTNAFNQGQYLAAAAESVLSQEGPEIEYFIMEPGSSDNTVQVLEMLQQRYPGRITVIRDADSGPADGLNRGFERASGDWFIYLNADDVFLPGAFTQAAAAIARNGNAGAIVGNGYIVDEHGRYIRRAISTPFTARRFVQGTAFALQQSTFYRAEAFRQVGGFNLANTTSWDAELLVDLDRSGWSIANAGGYWSLFRMQPNSITVSQRYAGESERTHARYFRDEMRRERGPRDAIVRRLRQNLYRLTHPAMTIARLHDRIAPRDHVFHQASPPAWARD
ncbi:glycosyltransferase [Altererythrobacter luteolus]|uniref:Glycosyltransferase n=1 Tax=Pontixanthobacter luteolus TaxID=295089 RepID=A0A6I4V1Q5_9SPHN|nr:glycosyltransferase [Pontixanthobacter luteolus]MXP47728.1 glycosyltransferase [Pontixanthobacter luteolus]